MLTTAPIGWLLCDGGEVPIDSYPELYSLLTADGTLFPFGANTDGSGGAGSTYFVLPDLRERFIGVADTSSVGDIESPSATHTHNFAMSTNTATASVGGGSHDHSFAAPNLNAGFGHSHTPTATAAAFTADPISNALMSGAGNSTAAFDQAHGHSVAFTTSVDGSHGHAINTNTPGARVSTNNHSHTLTFSKGSGATPTAVDHTPPHMECQFIVYAGAAR